SWHTANQQCERLSLITQTCYASSVLGSCVAGIACEWATLVRIRLAHEATNAQATCQTQAATERKRGVPPALGKAPHHVHRGLCKSSGENASRGNRASVQRMLE